MEIDSIHKKVPKVWGSETWIVNTDDYCGKILNLDEGCRCSMHYHKIKDETFYILEGRVLIEMNGETAIMEKGQSLRVKPYSKHRFTGLENSKIIEFSTHHEDSDSHRKEFGGRIDLSELEL